MDDISSQIKVMEEERHHYRNLLRRPKSPEVEAGRSLTNGSCSFPTSMKSSV